MKNNKCEKCGKPLNDKDVIWLELSLTSGHYYNEIPLGHESQGAFPFGKDCAKQVTQIEAECNACDWKGWKDEMQEDEDDEEALLCPVCNSANIYYF